MLGKPKLDALILGAVALSAFSLSEIAAGYGVDNAVAEAAGAVHPLSSCVVDVCLLL